MDLSGIVVGTEAVSTFKKRALVGYAKSSSTHSIKDRAVHHVRYERNNNADSASGAEW